MSLHTRQLLHRLTNTKCRIDTVVSPDDGHIVAQNNVEERNKHTKKNCAPVGFICKITISKIA